MTDYFGKNTVKPAFFACPSFRDHDDVAKIKGREYSKSYGILMYYLSSKQKHKN